MTDIFYMHIASMVFGQPLLTTWAQYEAVKAFLVRRIEIGPEAKKLEVVEVDSRTSVPLVKTDGMAIIPIHGALTSRRGRMGGASREIMSYEKIGDQLQAALGDKDVEHIVFDVDSHGGVSTGAFELAEKIYDSREKKPSTAVINHNGYSAAYLLGSSANRVVLGPTSGVGSIGVIAEHADLSGAEEKAGVKFTTVFAGDRKNDLSPHGPPTEQSLAYLNNIVQRSYAMFVDAVAKNRSLDPAAVRATEAAVYRGQQAIDAGLADELTHPQDAVDGIAGKITERRANVMRQMNMQARAAETQNRI